MRGRGKNEDLNKKIFQGYFFKIKQLYWSGVWSGMDMIKRQSCVHNIIHSHNDVMHD